MRKPIASLEELDPPAQAAARRLILSLADTKRILGIRYSDWLLGAPSIEAGIAASAMAQDEWGHARLLYSMLKDLQMDPVEVEHAREASAYLSVPALDEPFQDWAALIAGVVVVDGALSHALDGFRAGLYKAASGRIGKMLGEEAFHRDLGLGWFRRLAAGTSEGRDRLRGAVGVMAETTLHALAPGDERARLLASEGVTSAPDDLSAAILDAWQEPFRLVGLPLPVWDGGRAPAGWDADRSRTVGAPGEEAVERARGDRNRMLFVE